MKNWKILLAILFISIFVVACGETTIETLETTIETTLETILETTVPPTTEPIISDPDITFKYKLVNDDLTMPYALCTPSTADTADAPIPLIVWLHGRGDGSTDIYKVGRRGLPCAMFTWPLDGFNAYVVCPQLTGKWDGRWFTNSAKKHVDDVIERIIQNYNIDTDRIIIAGHSDGGMGALYMAATDDNEYYSAVVQITGHDPGVDMTHITEISARGYIGSPAYGESAANYYFAVTDYAELIGEDNVFILDAGHVQVAVDAFLLDENNDNKSDLIEWMLTQYK